MRPRGSKAGHINCKTGKNFKESLKKHFNHVFLFSMNDEVVQYWLLSDGSLFIRFMYFSRTRLNIIGSLLI